MHTWLAVAVLTCEASDSLAGALASACKAGDPIAGLGLADWTEEEQVNHSPFKVGDKIFICTVTLYYVGEVTEVGLGWVRLKDCSWVHWTGRISSLIASGDMSKQHGNRRPRSEYLGDWTVFIQAAVSYGPWRGMLPKESY